MKQSLSYLSEMLNIEFEDLFRMIGDVSQEFLWFKNKESKFVYSNNAHNLELGIDSLDELIGKSDFDFYPHEFAQQTFDDEQELMRMRGSQLYKPEFLKMPNGKVQWIQSSKYVLCDKNDEVIGVWGIGSNITKQKETEFALEKTNVKLEEALELSREMEEAAQRASSSKGQFLANMSHEIRTPMNAIIGLSELMAKTDLDAKQLDYNKKILASAKALLSIINSILDYSKIEAGKMELEAVPFNLDDILDSLSSMLTLKAEQKGIELLFDISINVPHNLIGDPIKLAQVLVNLVNNALKFTERGNITLRMVAEDFDAKSTRLMVEVEDTGIGMKEEQVQKLFKPFTQADASVTRHFGGTGLGLAISKEIIEMMGGEISVESEYGVGSKFSFEIIIPFDTHNLKSRKCPQSLKGMNVLVVDDNEEARRIEAKMLASFGFNVCTANSAENAISILDQDNFKPKLILMDYLMPGEDGLEASKRIKEMSVSDEIPEIMMVSAYNKEETQKQAAEIGIRNFLSKPINPSLLFDAIMEMFGESRLVQQKGDETSCSEELDAIRGARLLLVEDNAINQQVAKEILNSEGFEVIIADNGQIALDMIREATPDDFDAILMDIQMPVMDGRQATQAIRKLDSLMANIPIIAMTAHALDEEKELNIVSGMNAQVNKPFEIGELLAVLVSQIKPGISSGAGVFFRNEPVTQVNIVIPGIDTQAGLSRTVGNLKLYHDLLKRFVDSYADVMERLGRNEAAGNMGENEIIIHTLKGAGGNLGAVKLFEAAVALETGYKNRKPSPQEKAHFIKELDSVVENIRSYLETVSDKPKQKLEDSTISDQEMLGMLKLLSRQLDDFNMEAQTTMENVALCMEGEMAEDFDVIEALIGDLAYQEASRQINTFIDKYMLHGGGDNNA